MISDDDLREWIAYLNNLVDTDPEAMDQLVKARVGCNKLMAEHPTVQVVGKSGVYEVGILGILNGKFGADEKGYGPLAAHFDDESGKLTSFMRRPKGE